MSGDVHVRIRERLGVKLPRATRPVAHCRSEREARALLAAIDVRLKECRLEMHPEKSGVVYCKDNRRRKDYPRIQFTFLGYTFDREVPRPPTGKSGRASCLQ